MKIHHKFFLKSVSSAFLFTLFSITFFIAENSIAETAQVKQSNVSAKKQVGTSLDISSKDDILRSAAMALSFQKKYEEAIAIYLELQKKLPENPVILYELGLLYEKLNRVDEALESYNGALSLQASFSQARLQIAKVYISQRKSREAIKELLKYTKKNPKEPEGQFYLGMAYLLDKRLKTAEKTFQQVATTKSPLQGRAFYYIGKIRLRMGDQPGSKKAYAMAMKADPTLSARIMPDAKGGASSVRLNYSLFVQGDTNVALLPDTVLNDNAAASSQLPTNKGLRVVGDIRGTFPIKKSDSFQMNSSAGLFFATHTHNFDDLKKFDVYSPTANITTKFLSQTFITALEAGYRGMWTEYFGLNFAQELYLWPSINIAFTKTFDLTTGYRLTGRKFIAGVDALPPIEQRDAFNHSINVQPALSLGKTAVDLGLQYELNSAKGLNSRYIAYRARPSVSYFISPKLTTTGGFEIYYRNFDKYTGGFVSNREDFTTGAGIGLDYQFSQKLMANIGYRYTQNNSLNLKASDNPLFEYTRHVFALGISYFQ